MRKLCSVETIESTVTPGTKWRIRGLTGLEWLDLTVAVPPGATADRMIDGNVAKVYLSGLVGWVNYIDPDTRKAVPFTEENKINRLDRDEINEIINAVGARSGLNQDTEKNSPSPSRSRRTGKNSTA